MIATHTQGCAFMCACHLLPFTAAVEEKIAAWTLLPVHNGEGLQVLRYENSQKYDAHWVSLRTYQLGHLVCTGSTALCTLG